jgi:hypothetical protein
MAVLPKDDTFGTRGFFLFISQKEGTRQNQLYGGSNHGLAIKD